MKVEIKIKKEVDLKILAVKAGVRYWEDATVNGEEDTEGAFIPCRTNDLWCPKIDIETGIITNWHKGHTANIHYKVCDQLGYDLIDNEGNVVLSAEDGYVPNTLCPKGSGYGDYIKMDIDENGQIADWDFNFSEFEANEDDY